MIENRSFKSLGIAFSIFALASACSPKSETDVPVETETTAPATVSQPAVSIEESAINIENGMVRPPLGGKTMTAGYFSMTLGQDDRIIAASGDFAEKIELHTHEMADGMMQMRKVDGVDVKAGETVVFEPKGRHLMIFGVKELTLGDAVDVTFSFESGRTAVAGFTVAAPDVSHAGHHDH